jgi:hypothetical protein
MNTLPGQADVKGFLASLFDFSFSSLVTTKIVRFLYILLLVVGTVAAVVVLLGALAEGGPGALLAIVVVPVLWLIGVIYLRVLMETLIVLFRIAENVQTIARSKGGEI